MKDHMHNRLIIGVLAGKGGVGKSTLTQQLAKALHRSGRHVGVIDADVYGPSMGHLLPSNLPPKQAGQKILPVWSDGIALISASHLSGRPLSVVRAPIATQLVSQFIDEVEWKGIDTLLIDFPPGTGDIHITLLQKLTFNGILAITTPQMLSLLDVRKSLQMCVQMGAFITGIIENMSYFADPNTGEHYQLFGKGAGKLLSEEFHIPFLAQLPIDPSPHMQCCTHLFDKLAVQIPSLIDKNQSCAVHQEDEQWFVVKWVDGKTSRYLFSDIQRHCLCAKCRAKDPSLPLPNVIGKRVVRVGNYGIQVQFSSGCSKGIYPFTLLRELDR